MTDSDIIAEAAEKLLADLSTPKVVAAAEGGVFPELLWRGVEEAGFPLALMPEEAGGLGLDPESVSTLLRRSAYHAAPVPLPETMLAVRLLAQAGIDLPAGPLALVSADLMLTPNRSGWRVEGVARRVAWGAQATALVAVTGQGAGARLVLLPREGYTVIAGHNLADEPRDDLEIAADLPASGVAASPIDAQGLLWRLAALRAIQMAGALERALDLTIAYAGERVQFGKPLGRFQAVQQALAAAAGQVAAAVSAASLAAEAVMHEGEGAHVLAAVAKSRCGEAAGIVAGIAHQIHGAIGFSHEHPLRLVTRRLWAWRDEHGAEAFWNRRLGEAALAAPGGSLWHFIVAA
jgi:acyl-CoA dehydrogenase